MDTFGRNQVMKRKVILYFMIIILLTLGLVMLGFGLAIRQYYYEGISNEFQNQAEKAAPVLPNVIIFSNEKLMDFSDEIIKNYQYKGAELQLLKRGGQLIQSSTGFYEDITYSIEPRVLKLKTVYKFEKNDYSNEKIMAVYTPLIYEGQVVGVLRYIISIRKVNILIRNLMSYAMIICVIVAAIVFLVSLHLGNSIVRPLKEIIDFTKNMPNDQYKKRIAKVYPYELGEMAKMLNNMANEILNTNRLKNDFISSVTHELRTPLTGIKGWIETMQAPYTLSDEELALGLRIMNDESERLISLVENLLDFSRYQSDRVQLVTSSLNIDILLHEVTFQLQKKAEKKGINLIVETIPATILADGDKLKQVLLNILDNAIKFSNKDSNIYVTQSINLKNVLIEISDAGIGIKQENLKHIMESFYKIDPKSIGAGLGLAISRNIVDLHGGTLRIDSEYGKGASVSISLPFEGSREM